MQFFRSLCVLLGSAVIACGAVDLAHLSPSEQQALEKQIDKEVSLARAGNVMGFSTSFTSRLTAAQRTEAGLDTLSAEQLADVDAHVAHLLRQRPAYSYTRTRVTPNSIETETAKAKLSGQVSFTYGTDGHGNNFYGGELTTIWESPSRKTAIALTLARYKGDGIFFNSCHGPTLAPTLLY